jgi:hypothetical protein
LLTALVLGGAAGVWEEARAAHALFTPGLTVAVNDAIAQYDGHLDIAVTLHPDKMAGWRYQREANGFKPAQKCIGHKQADGIDETTGFLFPGQKLSGSSGLFAVKVALDAGCERVVLAGVPMTDSGAHFFDSKPWTECRSFHEGWQQAMPHIQHVVRSMSGWTREILGAPTPGWLAGSSA